MSLSVRTSAMAGAPLGGGADWGDSPYGSLMGLGPRKLKKKPVLVLADEELAQAHLAMAMGGAEIMEMQPDPVAAPRPRQPAVMLGLVPMGVDDTDEGRAAWTPPAPVLRDEFADEDEAPWQPLPEFDEPEPEEAEVQVWEPEPEPETWDEAVPLPADDYAEPPATEPVASDFQPEGFAPVPEPAVPSIEDQLERMRERLAKRAAAAAAAATAPVVPAATALAPAERPLSTIERLELDDWSGSASLRGFIPPQEQDLHRAPVPEPAPPATVRPAPAPPPPAAPPVFNAAPEPVRAEPVPPAPVRQDPVMSKPVQRVAPPVPVIAEPLTVEDAYEPDLAAILPEDDHAALNDPLGAWAEHVTPVAPPRRHAGIRARLSDGDAWQGEAEEPRPSLLARLWGWLRGRF